MTNPDDPTNTKSSTTISSRILFWGASYCTSILNTPASFGNSIERPNTSFRYNVIWFIFNRGFDYLTNVFIRNFKKQTNANFLGLFKHLKSGERQSHMLLSIYEYIFFVLNLISSSPTSWITNTLTELNYRYIAPLSWLKFEQPIWFHILKFCLKIRA